MSGLLNNLVELLSGMGDKPLLAYVLIFAVLVLSGAGVPVAEEIIVLAAGFLAYQKIIDIPGAWVCCYVGILIADSIVIYIGWHFGKAVLHRRWVKRFLHPRRVLWAKHQVHDHGAWMIAASRFIPGSRYPTLLISGMMHLKRWKFLIADGTAAIVSVSLQLLIGWWLGHLSSNIGELLNYQFEIAVGMTVIGVVIIGCYIFVRWRRHVAKRNLSSNAK